MTIFKKISRWLQENVWDLFRSDKEEPNEPNESGIVDNLKDFEPLVWLDANVSSWKVTTKLNAHISGDQLVLANDKHDKWPRGLEARGGGAINANAWVLVNLDGKWHIATWEWLRTGQHNKDVDWLKGTDRHIHRAPLSTWEPKSGETYGFMVSTPARGAERTLNERSDVSLLVWK